jgi:hypothetical protein
MLMEEPKQMPEWLTTGITYLLPKSHLEEPKLLPAEQKICHSVTTSTIITTIAYTAATAIYLSNSVAPEPEGSSPYSQEPATSPYPEPAGSNVHSPSQSP